MKTIKFIILVFLLWFMAHSIYITIDGLYNKPQPADIALVLGNKVNEDGSLSNRLKARLDKGIELYKKSLVKKLIVSGGLGKEGYYEAEKMKEYLIANNIPDTCIIADNKGDNTLLSVNHTLRMQPVLQYNSVTIVSQFYHIARTKLLFHKAGFANVSGASPVYFEWRDFYSIAREFFGYYKTLVFVKKEDLLKLI